MCPIIPDHKPWLVVGVNNQFWIDHAHPFGAHPASSNAGQMGNAVVDIWDAKDTDGNFISQLQLAVKNSSFFYKGFSYHHDCGSTLDLIASLNVPWHLTKTGDQFVNIFTFISSLWDLINH